MASRKNLKKAIKYVANELLTDCMVIRTIGDADNDKLAEVIARTIQMEKEFVARTNHTEPGCVRLYYKQLRDAFAKEANEIADQILTL